LIQGFEALGDGVQGYLRKGGVGVAVMSGYKLMISDYLLCLIQRYGMSIYKIQHGIKSIQVNDKDWILCW